MEGCLKELADEREHLLKLASAQTETWETELRETFRRLAVALEIGPAQAEPPTLGGIALAVQPASQPPSLGEASQTFVDPVPEQVALSRSQSTSESWLSEGWVAPPRVSVCSAASAQVGRLGSGSAGGNIGTASATIRAAAGFGFSEQNGSWFHALRGKLVKFIDYLVGPLVFLDSLILLMELEIEGSFAGAALGLDKPRTWSDWAPTLRSLDTAFVFIFAAEMLFRLLLDRGVCGFFKDAANWFDTFIVLSGLANLLIFELQSAEPGQDQSLGRLVRVIKSLRALRILRSLRFVSGLRLLVMACQCFLPSLCWSMVLLGTFISMGGLALGNLLMEFITDEAVALEDRQWVWTRYGTAYRALYTLYEVTFAGNWPTNVRPVLEKVSHAYVIFFVLYVTVIVFAVIRVITAIFLKDTLDAAHNDAEHLVVEKMKKKAEYVQKLEAVFQAIDKSGDGMISEERLSDILSNPKVAAYFQTLELDVHESRALFHILDNGDGEVTREEFIDGILRCKGGARAIDQIEMHADLKQLDAKLMKLVKSLQKADVIKTKPRKSRGNLLKRAHHLKVFHFGSTGAEHSGAFYP